MPARRDDWLRTADAALYYYKQTGDIVPSTQTVRNWMRKGKRGYTGDVAKLKCQKKGRIPMTTKEWMDNFIEELSNERATRIVKSKRSHRPPPPPE